MDGEHLADLLTEVALHFEHETADFACLIIGAPGDQLLDVRIHTR